MKVAFDTSVLVAALVAPHPRHALAEPWVSAAAGGRLDGSMSWHAAAECWSVLTKLPLDPPIGGAQAESMIGRVVAKVRARPLGARVYRAAMARCSARGVHSGAIFDALHLIAAEADRCDILLTFNPDDFDRLREPGSPETRVPLVPPP